MALWSGRFTEGADAFTQRFGASLPVDQRLYVEDIAGSIAHANMLAAQGIIATADAEAIAEGLQGILADITSGALTFDVMESEDIHMAIEAELTRRVGDAGARLHTGRSRNDQVATDTRLYAKRRAGELMAANVALREALIAQAEANFSFTVPDTHCWVWARKASKASFSGENHRPLYTCSAQVCSMASLWCSTPRSRHRSSRAL